MAMLQITDEEANEQARKITKMVDESFDEARRTVEARFARRKALLIAEQENARHPVIRRIYKFFKPTSERRDLTENFHP